MTEPKVLPDQLERGGEGFLTHAAEAKLLAERDMLRAALEKYADHQSWRCAHPDRYPWGAPWNDCRCGLVSTLKGLGFATVLAAPLPSEQKDVKRT